MEAHMHTRSSWTIPAAAIIAVSVVAGWTVSVRGQAPAATLFLNPTSPLPAGLVTEALL